MRAVEDGQASMNIGKGKGECEEVEMVTNLQLAVLRNAAIDKSRRMGG